MDPFDTCKSEAFRVEALPYYADSEDGRSRELDHWSHTGLLPAGYNEEWKSMVTAAVSRGARVRRLRIISTPPSSYERFELMAAYNIGISAGEEIRVTSTAGTSPIGDYWLYDDSTIESMHYSDKGVFLGSTVRAATSAERDIIEFHRKLFSEARPISEFVRRHLG